MSNEEIFEIIKKQLEEHEKRISRLEALSQTKPELIAKKLSVKEFLLSKKPMNDVQKTLVIGYYLEKHEGFASFNVKDLENGFRSSKETVPTNINVGVDRNVGKGYIMDAKEKKDNKRAWVLTNSGEQFVESGLKEKK